MLHHLDSHHVELGLVPAADDVDAPTPAGHVIEGGAHLGHHDRVEHGDMDRRIDLECRGRLEETGRPGHRLE